VVALELKHRAPKAHTMLEIVYVRWGPAAHGVFFFFAVLTNLLVSLSMLQGGLGAQCGCCHEAVPLLLTPLACMQAA
jgi:hypothetical protein